MSSIVYSQTIGGIAISRSGVEFCVGSVQDSQFYVSSDVKFPLSMASTGYMNFGLGYKFNSDVFSLKCGLYSPQKYEPLRLQYGVEYIRELKTFYVGISYLTDTKLSFKLLVNLE